MRPMDVLILILFLPAILFGTGYLYMSSQNICGPDGPFLCVGFNWIVDMLIIPLVIVSSGAGMFFFCRRFKTEQI